MIGETALQYCRITSHLIEDLRVLQFDVCWLDVCWLDVCRLDVCWPVVCRLDFCIGLTFVGSTIVDLTYTVRKVVADFTVFD